MRHFPLRLEVNTTAIVWAVALLFLFSFSFTVAATTYPVTIYDDLDRAVTLAAKPERIISIAPSHTEMLFALGLGDKVVAVDEFSNYPDAVAGKETVGSPAAPSLERIVALEPDLVLIGDVSDKALVEKLAGLQLTVVGLAPQTLDEVYSTLQKLGLACGASTAATDLVAEMKQKVAKVASAVSKAKTSPVILFEIWSDPLYTAGPDSFIDELITLAGGSNIAYDAQSAWPVLSMEAAIARNPAVILSALDETTTVVKGKHKALWSTVKAVKDQRVHFVNQDIVSRPGPRLADGLAIIAEAIHPDLF